MACPLMYESNSAWGRFRLLAVRFLMNSRLQQRLVKKYPSSPDRSRDSLLNLVMKLMFETILGGLALRRM